MNPKLFINIGFVILFINTILFLKGFSKQEKPFKILAFYSLAMFGVQMTSSYYSKHGMNNLFLSHFYFIIQFILLSYFFYTVLKQNLQKLILKLCLLIGLLILIIQYANDFEKFYSFNELEIVVTSVPIILFCSFYLYNLLSAKRKYYFFTIGLLIYLFGSTIVFLSANIAISMNSRLLSDKIFNLNIGLYIVYQLYVLYELKTILFNKNKIEN